MTNHTDLRTGCWPYWGTVVAAVDGQVVQKTEVDGCFPLCATTTITTPDGRLTKRYLSFPLCCVVDTIEWSIRPWLCQSRVYNFGPSACYPCLLTCCWTPESTMDNTCCTSPLGGLLVCNTKSSDDVNECRWTVFGCGESSRYNNATKALPFNIYWLLPLCMAISNSGNCCCLGMGSLGTWEVCGPICCDRKSARGCCFPCYYSGAGGKCMCGVSMATKVSEGGPPPQTPMQ